MAKKKAKKSSEKADSAKAQKRSKKTESAEKHSSTERVGIKGVMAQYVAKAKALMTKHRWMPWVLSALIVVGVIWVIPVTRYATLNIVAEADASVEIIDQDTEQPIVGAKVTLGNGLEATTDEMGIAFFNDAGYGSTTALVEKSSYESLELSLEISSDDIVLGPFKLRSTGIPVEVTVTDWLTGNNILDFSASDESGENVFSSTEEGVATLNIPVGATGVLNYAIKADGYLDSELMVDTSTLGEDGAEKDPVALVRTGKHTFYSDRDGEATFYQTNYDGTEIEKLFDIGEYQSLGWLVDIPDSPDTFIMFVGGSNARYAQAQGFVYIDLSEGTVFAADDTDAEGARFDQISSDSERFVYRVYTGSDEQKYKIKSFEYATQKLRTYYDGPAYPNAIYDNATNTLINQFERRECGIQNVNYVCNTTHELSRRLLPDGDKTVLYDRDIGNFQSYNDDSFIYEFIIRNAAYATGYYEIEIANGEFPGTFLGDEWPGQPADANNDRPTPVSISPGGQTVEVSTRDGKRRLVVDDRIIPIDTTLELRSFIRWIDESTVAVNGSIDADNADYIVDIESGLYQRIVPSLPITYPLPSELP